MDDTCGNTTASSDGSRDPSPLVSVIVVNWNGRDFLRECLRSVTMSTYTRLEVLVSDNGSVDGSQEMIRVEFPFVRIIENKENRGFAEGSNAAIPSANGDLLFFVNNDARIHPECVQALVNTALSDRTIGILGCKVYFTEQDSLTLQHAGGVLYQSGYTTLIGHLRHDIQQYDREKDVDYVIGAAMMVTRPVIKAIGLFDPLFRLYYEETDLCYRARRGGFRVVYVPDAVVYHRNAMTVDRLYNSQAKRNCMETSRVTFALKNFETLRICKWAIHEVGMLASVLLAFRRQKREVTFSPWSKLITGTLVT